MPRLRKLQSLSEATMLNSVTSQELGLAHVRSIVEF